MIKISENLMAMIRAHAAEGYPHEIVGVMAGEYAEGIGTVTRLFRGQNQFRLAEEHEDGTALDALREKLAVEGASANRFFMTADEMRGVGEACRAEGIDILGFYHTHPDHPALPSATDLRFARETLPGYSYLIMSVNNGVPADTTCWILSDDESRFEQENIVSE